MYCTAICFIFVLATVSADPLDEENVTSKYESVSKTLPSSALEIFEAVHVKKTLLRACNKEDTYLWWSIFNNYKNTSLYTSFEENGDLYDGVLLDVSCESGLNILKEIVGANNRPDGPPKTILAAPNSSALSRILKEFNFEGRFLLDSLAVVRPPAMEMPSVLRIAIPEENRITDPAGAVIATKLLTHLRDTLGLTFSFRRGNFSDVLSGNADLLSDAVQMDEKSMERVVFLGRQIWRLRTLVLMKTPGYLWDTDALLRPFSTGTWLSVGGSILATGIVLRSVAFWESRSANSQPQSREESTWSFSIMTAMGMMCAQGFTSTTIWSAGRITLVTFEVFSLFVGLFYSSAMVTFLLTLPESRIKSAADLVDWPLSIAVDPDFFSIPDLLKSDDEIVRSVIGLKGEPMSLWDALSLATEQPAALLSGEHLTISAAGAALEVSTICRLDLVTLQPDWPLALVGSRTAFTPWLLERFRRATTHIAEVGMLSGDTRRAVARPLICLQSDVTDTEAIGFRAVWPGVAMLAIGHLLAVIIFFIELSVDAWHRYKPLHTKSA